MSEKTSSQISLIALMVANSVPLWGVLFYGWDLFQILCIYWLESAIVGFYNIFKMIIVDKLLSIIFVPFFIVHYGGFMTVHLILLFGFFAPPGFESQGSFFPSREIILPLLYTSSLPFISLFISHGISFFYNFLGKQEYKHAKSGTQMEAPYKRIMIMHITILFGGWLVLLFQNKVYALLILIALKTATDIYAHKKEHALL